MLQGVCHAEAGLLSGLVGGSHPCACACRQLHKCTARATLTCLRTNLQQMQATSTQQQQIHGVHDVQLHADLPVTYAASSACVPPLTTSMFQSPPSFCCSFCCTRGLQGTCSTTKEQVGMLVGTMLACMHAVGSTTLAGQHGAACSILCYSDIDVGKAPAEKAQLRVNRTQNFTQQLKATVCHIQSAVGHCCFAHLCPSTMDPALCDRVTKCQHPQLLVCPVEPQKRPRCLQDVPVGACCCGCLQGPVVLPSWETCCTAHADCCHGSQQQQAAGRTPAGHDCA
jgi:hypothetical protein